MHYVKTMVEKFLHGLGEKDGAIENKAQVIGDVSSVKTN